jgi:outer membrane receptor for ferric coprogen and ferric-rhodotorulic acid
MDLWEMNMRSDARCAVLLVLATASAAALGQTTNANETLETVLITAKRDDRVSKGATGLDLEIKDTPQSISVVTQEQMQAFGATDINAALRLATGINVEEWETNRTNYLARGFEIKNTQIDGVGLPNDWGIVTGAMDSFGYEKLEVIRGANGLLTGVGNASGTINYVRKRPTNTPQGLLSATGGSFDRMRIEADYSTPFTDDGLWAGRIVVAAEDGESWLRGLRNDRVFVYGVVDGQIGEKGTLTLGYSYQDANTDGNMWGALVLAYSDGTQAEFGRSASTTQDWAFWDTKNQTAFVEYTYALSNAWNLKATYNYREFQDDDKLFFVLSTTGIDRDTGLGLTGWPGSYRTDDAAHLIETSIDGSFELFGRTHEAIVGLSYGTSERKMDMRPVSPDDPAFGPLPPFPFPGNAVPEPEWGPLTEYSAMDQELKRFFAVSRIAVTDRLKAIVGVNFAEYHREGHQTGEPFDQTEREWSPYAGLTFEINDDVLVYASYSDIYQPQDFYDINGRYLDPSQGVNYEIGVKAEWLDKRLLATFAIFAAEQKGLGTYAGMTEDARYYYEGVDVDSKGIELEIVGRLSEYVDVVLGFTALELEGQDGHEIYEWVPRRTANLALSAKVPTFTALSYGINARWQSGISKVDEYTGVTIRQDSYALVNAFARWDVNSQLYVGANINNIGDEKYISSLYQIGFYGAPRNYSVNVGYRF